MRRHLFLVTLVVFLLTPAIAGAAWLPLVKCGGSGLTDVPCTPCDFFQTFHDLLNFVLIDVSGPIAAFMIVWAGGMMLLGGPNPKLYSQGKALITNTLIGVTIILVAYAATNTLMKFLVTTGEGDRWFEFSCPAGLEGISDIKTTFPSVAPVSMPSPTPYPAPGAPPAPGAVLPAEQGVACKSQTIDTCNTQFKCSPCTKYAQYFSSAKYGADASLLHAIMMAESSCAQGDMVSSAGAYGPMQMLLSTANKHTATCKIYEIDYNAKPSPKPFTDKNGKPMAKRIDAAWLLNLQNMEGIICLAAAEVKTLKGACGQDPRDIASGYNSGPKWCMPSRDCATTKSCDGGAMRAWECPWDNRQHSVCNTGLNETKRYAPKVAACAKQTQGI